MTKVRNPKLLIKFGKHLKVIRKNKGLSQEQLANDADIPLSQIGRIERGETNPSLSTLSSIALACNVSLSKLFEGL